MNETIFDTDFDPEDLVLCYDGTECGYAGPVKGLTTEQKRHYDRSTWFLLAPQEGYKALFVSESE